MTPVELHATATVARLDHLHGSATRRFLMFAWVCDGLCVYDDWTKYEYDNLSLHDVFGDGWELLTVFSTGTDSEKGSLKLSWITAAATSCKAWHSFYLQTV